MYDVHAQEYWDRAHLEREIDRIFDICHGCRLCFSLCPSFPALFDAVDGHEDEVAGMTAAEKAKVVDLCYQCKLCYNKCPYIPPHEFNLDFPRLMQRARNVDARARGVTFQDRMLGSTTLIGRIGQAIAPLSNWALRNPLNRVLMEKTVGIHRRMNMPAFQRETFPQWLARRQAQGRTAGGGHVGAAGTGSASGDATGAAADEAVAEAAREAPTTGRVALFSTCSVDYYHVEHGKALVQILEHLGIREIVRPPQVCCGMPAYDGGDLERTLAMARQNIETLAPLVRSGYDILIPGPTCSRMIKMEYPELVPGTPARVLAARSFDACEYLMKLHSEGKLDTRFPGSPPGKVAYHAPCHLRDQNIGFVARDLLKLIPGCEVEVVAQCSAVDGTWGMKSQYYELSIKMAGKLIRAIESAEPDQVAGDCPLAGLRIEQGTGKKVRHPLELVRDAYGIEPA